MRRVRLCLTTVLALGTGLLLADGCSSKHPSAAVDGAGGAGGTQTTTAAHTASASSGQSGMGGGSIDFTPDAGPTDAGNDVAVNPCGSKCGAVELCDSAHLGLDDNCDGKVDEGCTCNAGQVHACFKGDPSYHGAPGCYDGSESCSELGFWGPCIGGVHATSPDDCFNNDTSSCHPITAAPFANVDLSKGTGAFGAGATSETWAVTCPADVSPCPGVTGTSPADVFKPLQSGEYSVTYTKVVGDGGATSCTYPLFVGAPGLRVELTWEHTTADKGVDLDLHVHQPNTTTPWGVTISEQQDCCWANCTFDAFADDDPEAPHWFAGPPAVPPTPVNWYKDPVLANNTCYDDPQGVGAEWQGLNQGCHNPRLDVDDIDCDFSVTDSDSKLFCAPENVNVDFPPTDQWTRVGVHYYDNHGLKYDVHPVVKIFCDGALAAQLGPSGYYSPEAPVTFAPSDGGGGDSNVNRFWEVADVVFSKNQCGGSTCTVKPIYSDAAAKTPFFIIGVAADSSFTPAYPALP